jgi:hypothetical protein
MSKSILEGCNESLYPTKKTIVRRLVRELESPDDGNGMRQVSF